MFEDIDLKFCTHIHETLPSKICYVFFLQIFILGETVEKKKKIDIFSRNFQNLENPR